MKKREKKNQRQLKTPGRNEEGEKENTDNQA